MTGGGGGLGRALVQALSDRGADVAFSFRSRRDGAEEERQRVESLGRRVFMAEADARRPGSIARFVSAAADSLGGLDILVNNVGVFRRVPLEQVREEDLDEAFDVNVKAAVMGSQAAAPHLRSRGGVIVNVASLGGVKPWKAYLPYCVSKAALIMATRCLAVSLAPEVRVNAVAPGILDPPGGPPELEKKTPLGRFGTHDEAVQAVLFLAQAASYTTGETLFLDGGRSLV